MPASNILVALGAVWGLLVIASLLVWSLTKFKPGKHWQELVARTKSWWVMIAVFTFALVTNRMVSLVFFAFISFLALKEYFTMIETRRADRRILFWAYLAIPAQYYWAGINWFGMFIIFIPVYMFLFMPFRLLITGETEGFLKSIGTIQWGLMLTVFTLSHMAYLLVLPESSYPGITGPALLLFLVFLTQFNDVAQYTCGKLFGHFKIVPAISPKKTWAGFLGGLIITTLVAALIYPYLTPFSLGMAVFAGLLIASAGFIGDVTISAVKRDLGVKDTGSIIPGHGGILDRVDSLTYAAPLFFHFVYFFYY